MTSAGHPESDSAGIRIERRAFIQSALILLLLMIIAGVLTNLIPAGEYTRVMEDGRQTIVPGSFHFSQRPGLPVWRWLTAPVEVLFTTDGVTVVVIIAFMLLVAASFAVLEASGVLSGAIGLLVTRFGERKELLLAIISLFLWPWERFLVCLRKSFRWRRL